MAGTITVKGTGSVSVKPDYVILNMVLDSLDQAYDRAMELASEQISALTDSLGAASFAKEDVKTTDFNVNTNYESVKQRDGSSKRVFRGYQVRHQLKLGFDFNTDRLSDAIAAIASCPARPELKIRFTVKDPAKVSEELLISATENAQGKAEVICKASGVGLGELVRIYYDWGELNVYSHTRYEMDDYYMESSMVGSAIEFEPDDIEAGDTVTFEWEIV